MLPPNGATNGQGIYFGAFDDHPTFEDMGNLIGAALGRQRVRAIRPPALLMKAIGAIGEEIGRRFDRASMFNRDKVREAMASPWLCTAAKARRQLGFATPHSVAVRLAQTAEWYREQGWL
jgi:nucleoside-diphosphate-sugar epimerase